MKNNKPHTQSVKTHIARAFACATLLMFASAGIPARAQQVPTPDANDENVVRLDLFEVKSSGDIGYMSQNAAEVTRMSMAIEDIPMNVTIFNQQFIDDILATDTSEVIMYDASSVKTHENDQFIARGFNNPGSSFLNGFAQVTSQASGGTTTGGASQPMANIERVEVIRGPAAILFGAGAYGATYNRITKRPKSNPYTQVRGIYTDSGLYRGEIDVSGPVPLVNRKKLLYRLNAVYEDGETWFGAKRGEKVIAPTLSWEIGSRLKIFVEYFYNQRDTQAN